MHQFQQGILFLKLFLCCLLLYSFNNLFLARISFLFLIRFVPCIIFSVVPYYFFFFFFILSTVFTSRSFFSRLLYFFVLGILSRPRVQNIRRPFLVFLHSRGLYHRLSTSSIFFVLELIRGSACSNGLINYKVTGDVIYINDGETFE